MSRRSVRSSVRSSVRRSVRRSVRKQKITGGSQVSKQASKYRVSKQTPKSRASKSKQATKQATKQANKLAKNVARNWMKQTPAPGPFTQVSRRVYKGFDTVLSTNTYRSLAHRTSKAARRAAVAAGLIKESKKVWAPNNDVKAMRNRLKQIGNKSIKIP